MTTVPLSHLTKSGIITCYHLDTHSELTSPNFPQGCRVIVGLFKLGSRHGPHMWLVVMALKSLVFSTGGKAFEASPEDEKLLRKLKVLERRLKVTVYICQDLTQKSKAGSGKGRGIPTSFHRLVRHRNNLQEYSLSAALPRPHAHRRRQRLGHL